MYGRNDGAVVYSVVTGERAQLVFDRSVVSLKSTVGQCDLDSPNQNPVCYSMGKGPSSKSAPNTQTGDMPPTTASSGIKKPTKSRSTKAGLIWPVSRTHKKVLSNLGGGVARVSAAAPVYIAAVVEFFMAEILELAGNLCKPARKRITPQDILQVLRSDKEMQKASKGLRVLVGDRVKDSSEIIMTVAALKSKKEGEAKRKADRAAAMA